MNRRGFLGKIGLALAGIAVAPAVNLLSEPETICHHGLLWQIQNIGSTATYSGEVTMAMFNELIASMENQYNEEDEVVMDAGVLYTMGMLNSLDDL